MPTRAALALTLLLPAAALGQRPDPEPAAPHTWHVVLHCPRPHPLLTPAFRQQLRRDLLAALQPGLGPLGTVRVFDLADTPRDQWDPLWQQFTEKEWAALDTPRDLSGLKTHFLQVDVRDGAYHLESRQHDGFTGLASPVVRRQSTRAAELVGRVAGLMLDRDFGACGTVEPVANRPDDVDVIFRGGRIPGGELERFVRPGDVLAVAIVRKAARAAAPPPVRTASGRVVAPPPGSEPPPAYVSQPREFTLLRVTDGPRNGSARCKVFSRFQTPFPAAGGIVGYRCLKVATTDAPLTLRLAAGDGVAHRQSALAQVRATDTDYLAPPAARDNLDLRDGLFRSSRALSNVALVTVVVGATRSERFPLPVVSADPVVLRFELDPADDERVKFERACLDLSRRVADARLAQAACFDSVAKLISAQKNADAYLRARAGAAAVEAEEKAIADELRGLQGQVEKSPRAAGLLAGLDRQLVPLREAQGRLAERVKELEAVVAKGADPGASPQAVQAEAVATRIRVLLADGDADEALNAYDQLVTLLPNDPAVKQQRDKLRAEWTPKNADHAAARDYLLRTWPAVATVADFKDSLPALRGNTDKLLKAGDKLACRKLLTHFNAAGVKLADLIAPLDPASDADRKTLTDADEVRKVLEKIEADVRGSL